MAILRFERRDIQRTGYGLFAMFLWRRVPPPGALNGQRLGCYSPDLINPKMLHLYRDW